MGTLFVSDQQPTPIEKVVLSKFDVKVADDLWKQIEKPGEFEGQMRLRIDYRAKIGEDTESNTQQQVSLLDLFLVLLRDAELDENDSDAMLDLCRRANLLAPSFGEDERKLVMESIRKASEVIYPEKVKKPVRGSVRLDTSVTMLPTPESVKSSGVTLPVEEFSAKPVNKKVPKAGKQK